MLCIDVYWNVSQKIYFQKWVSLIIPENNNHKKKHFQKTLKSDNIYPQINIILSILHPIKKQSGWVVWVMCFKGCPWYIFPSLFCMCKRDHFWKKEKSFFESSFSSWDNQILIFQVFKCHDLIKFLSMKHETHLLNNLEVNRVKRKIFIKKYMYIYKKYDAGTSYSPFLIFKESSVKRNLRRCVCADFDKFW